MYTILDLPRGTFLGAGVETVALFFEKGKPTEKDSTTNSMLAETWVKLIH